MADIPKHAQDDTAPAPCGNCTRCLNASGETAEMFGMRVPLAATRMVLCVQCGNKRCPHAADCALACTDSNESGQPGSNYANVKPWRADGSAPIPTPQAPTPAEETMRRVLELHKPPFKVVEGAIYDANGNKIADDRVGVMRVRGWGRLSYLADGAELQNALGDALAQALTDFWNLHLGLVGEQKPLVDRRRPRTPAEAAFEALGVDTSDEAADRAERKALRIERDALRERVAQLEGTIPVLTEKVNQPVLFGLAPAPAVLPHPDCDEACHYHCTEAGTRPARCIENAARKDKASCEEALAEADAESLPPPDYFMSCQHGSLKLAYTDESDSAYRWQGVWLAPRYEQNAAVRQKAALYDELVGQLADSAFAEPRHAVSSAVQAARLSDELIAGVAGSSGLATPDFGKAIKTVRAVLKVAGIDPAR